MGLRFPGWKAQGETPADSPLVPRLLTLATACTLQPELHGDILRWGSPVHPAPLQSRAACWSSCESLQPAASRSLRCTSPGTAGTLPGQAQREQRGASVCPRPVAELDEDRILLLGRLSSTSNQAQRGGVLDGWLLEARHHSQLFNTYAFIWALSNENFETIYEEYIHLLLLVFPSKQSFFN